ncbi:hypothetical protein [Hydromonas duriensis]|uniref:Uncharacterized protein n=1 Tax=Hydromonas duriensis TaxID=1527608 RepID=A0A4R6Y1F0_9BURK|nr:hypothetical protein [Hydromonas duriensis]TDR28976.1 hypothetical protein DFR44_1293 [Hydromonas duriensis]
MSKQAQAKLKLIAFTVMLTLALVSLLKSFFEPQSSEDELSANEHIIAKDTARTAFKYLIIGDKFKVVESETAFIYKNSKWGGNIVYVSPLPLEDFEPFLKSENWEERSRRYYPKGFGRFPNASVYDFCKNNVRLSLIGGGNYARENVNFAEVSLVLENDTCIKN